MADHQRRGVLGLLAGGYGRLPRQRRHRRRGDPLRRRHRRRGVRPRRRAGAAGRDGPAVALARPPRHPRPVPDRRRDRPDEYSAIADNNVYTNLMAQQNLRAAADQARAHPGRARQLGVDEEEMAQWRDAAERVVIPYDSTMGIHSQAEGFTRHQVWDFEATTAGAVPAAAALPVLRPLPQAGGQAGRPGARDAPAGRRLHRRSRRRPTSTTTSGSRSATRRCRPARRR